MKNSSGTPFNVSVPIALIISVGMVILNVIINRFGTFSSYSSGGRHGNMEIVGILVPLVVLLSPIFKKDYRKILWTRENILLAFFVLILSIIFIIITYANKEYYRPYWFNVNYFDRQWNDAPRIRWDIWNIINKQYPQ